MTLVDALPRACFTEASLDPGADDRDELVFPLAGLLWNPLRSLGVSDGLRWVLESGVPLVVKSSSESWSETGEGRTLRPIRSLTGFNSYSSTAVDCSEKVLARSGHAEPPGVAELLLSWSSL